MNSQGQMIIELIFITTVLLGLVFATVSQLHKRRIKMAHETMRTEKMAVDLDVDLTKLYSQGIITFDSKSAQANVEQLLKEDWEVEKKLRDDQGRYLFLLKKGKEALLINKNIGIKVCLEDC